LLKDLSTKRNPKGGGYQGGGMGSGKAPIITDGATLRAGWIQ
jgi:hypothetical protein